MELGCGCCCAVSISEKSFFDNFARPNNDYMTALMDDLLAVYGMSVTFVFDDGW